MGVQVFVDSGPSLVVRAMASGRKVAAAIDQYLRNK